MTLAVLVFGTDTRALASTMAIVCAFLPNSTLAWRGGGRVMPPARRMERVDVVTLNAARLAGLSSPHFTLQAEAIVASMPRPFALKDWRFARTFGDWRAPLVRHHLRPILVFGMSRPDAVDPGAIDEWRRAASLCSAHRPICHALPQDALDVSAVHALKRFFRAHGLPPARASERRLPRLLRLHPTPNVSYTALRRDWRKYRSLLAQLDREPARQPNVVAPSARRSPPLRTLAARHPQT